MLYIKFSLLRYRAQNSLPDVYGYDSNQFGDLGVCHGDDLFTLFK